MDGKIIVKVPKGIWPFRWQKQGFHFCMESWLMMSNYTQLAMNEFNLLPGDRYMILAIYNAARAYNVLEHGKRFTYTEKQVESWLDRIPSVDSKALVNTLLDSQIGGKTIREIAGEEDEKKK